MDTAKDSDYDAAQTGYGAADDEADETTPAQRLQQPAHEREDGDEGSKETGENETDDEQYSGPDPDDDEKGDGADEDQGT